MTMARSFMSPPRIEQAHPEGKKLHAALFVSFDESFREIGYQGVDYP